MYKYRDVHYIFLKSFHNLFNLAFPNLLLIIDILCWIFLFRVSSLFFLFPFLLCYVEFANVISPVERMDFGFTIISPLF